MNNPPLAAAREHNARVDEAGTTQILLLGPVRLLVGGEPVRLGGAKQQAVLAVLALRSPRPVTADQLLDALWGDDPPASARNAVQVYVSGLRRLLPPGTGVERDGDAYRLVGPDLLVDAAELERRVAEGRSALRSGDPHRAADALGSALSLWAGTPLGGLEALPFHEDERRRLDDTRWAAALDRAEALLRTRDVEAAATAASAVVDARPFHERGWTVLVTALYLAGRQAEALETCRRVRDLLRDELGIDPSPELARVEEGVLRQDLDAPWADEAAALAEPGVAPEEAAPLPPVPSPFVGRDALVDDVVRRLEGGGVVSLVGLGGIGKTASALAVAHRLVSSGRSVRFCELETETSARSALDRVCRATGVDAGDAPAAALRTLPQGTVVVLDNVEQVAGLGAALAGALHPAGPAVLATSRAPLRLGHEDVVRVPALSAEPQDGRPSPAALLFAAVAARVRPGLDPAAAVAPGERVGVLLDGIPLAIELAAARARVLTVEQVAARLESGTASALDGGRRADVPDRQASLGAVVSATLQALPREAVELLRLLASFDGWTSVELVEQVVEDPGGGLVDAVEDVVDAGLVDLASDGRLRVRTPVREHVVGADDPAERTRQDARVLDAVVALVEGVAPSLFGEEATSGLARLERDHDPVTGALVRAIASGAPSAATLVLGLNRYWLLSGRVSEGRRLVDAARTRLPLQDRDRTRLDVLGGTFAAYSNDARANEVLVPALEEAARLGLPVDRLVVNGWCTAAAVEAQHRRPEGSRRYAAEAVRLAASAGDAGLVALARDLEGFVASHLGDAETALRVHLDGLADARRSGDTHDVVSVLVSLVDDVVALGRTDDALALSGEAFELVASLGSSPVHGHVLAARGMALLLAERVPEAQGVLVEALRVARERFPDPVATGDRLALMALGAAVQRADEVAARWWGAATGLLEDQGLTPRVRLPAPLLTHADALEQRLDGRFAMLVTAGSASPRHVVDALLAG